MIKNHDSEQTINLTSSTVSINKSWKQSIKTKKRNQTKTISFISA